MRPDLKVAPPLSGALMSALLCVALALIPPFAHAIGDPALISLATRIAIYAIAAASLNFILGYGGLVSFGHAAYFGVGAYVAGMLTFHAAEGGRFLGIFPGSDQLLVNAPLAVLASASIAIVIGALSLRTRGVQFIMITLAFAQMMFFFFVSLKYYGGDDGLILPRRNELPFLNTRDDTTFYYVCLVAAILCFALIARLVRSRFGLVLQGIRQNERRMTALGIPVFRYQLVAFVIAGAIAGLAGALMASFAKFVSPDMLHWSRSGELMIMVIIGGAGSLLGPAWGAALLLGLETFLAARTEHWQIILGPILVVIALMTNGGVSALWPLFVGVLRRPRHG